MSPESVRSMMLRVARAWPWCLALGIALALVLVPDPPKTAVVPAGDWEISGAFVPVGPDVRQMPDSWLATGQARFWSNWSPAGGARAARLASPVFTLPAAGLGIPIRGDLGERGVHASIACLATGEQRVLARSRTNTDWAIARFDPGADWCPGEARVRMVVEVSVDGEAVAVGAPFARTAATAVKTSNAMAAAYLFLAWTLLAGLAWLAWGALARRSDPSLRVALVLAVLGLLGYGLFFAYAASVWAGTVATGGLALAGAWAAAGLLGLRPVRGASAPDRMAFLRTSTLWLVVALAVLGIHGLVDANAGAWSPNARFDPARWSSDNQIPMRIGQMLATGDMGNTGWMGPWSTTDRPPLAYGWHAFATKLFGSHLLPSDGTYLYHRYSWAMGVLLNTLWAPLVFLVLRRVGAGQRLALAMVAACLLSPFVLFNAGYVWPKMLSAAFGLAAAWLLFDGGRSPRRPLREDDAGFVGAALLSALALQSHGGAVFALPVMIALGVALRGLPTLRAMVRSAAVCLAILVPWMLYQRGVDPPGNALVKFAFAGTFGFGEEDVGVLDTIRRAYAALTPGQWLAMKADALRILLTGAGNQCGIGEAGQRFTVLDTWRARDFYYVLPSMLLVVVAGALGRLLPATRTLDRSVPWIGWALGSILLGMLMTLDCHLNHHQPYQAMLALHLGLLLAAARHAGYFVLAWLVIVGYGVVVWVLEPFQHFLLWDPSALGVLLLAALTAWRCLGSGTSTSGGPRSW